MPILKSTHTLHHHFWVGGLISASLEIGEVQIMRSMHQHQNKEIYCWNYTPNDELLVSLFFLSLSVRLCAMWGYLKRHYLTRKLTVMMRKCVGGGGGGGGLEKDRTRQWELAYSSTRPYVVCLCTCEGRSQFGSEIDLCVRVWET